jgi:hypothetical protein
MKRMKMKLPDRKINRRHQHFQREVQHLAREEEYANTVVTGKSSFLGLSWIIMTKSKLHVKCAMQPLL